MRLEVRIRPSYLCAELLAKIINGTLLLMEAEWCGILVPAVERT